MKYAQTVKKLLVFITYALWIVILVSFVTPAVPWGIVGKLMGKAAITMLTVVVLPGILRRFAARSILKQVQLFLMAIRRQTGDLMFTFAVAHAVWVRILLYLRFGLPSILSIPFFQVMGTITLLLLFPLFLTSNNYSIRLLKKNWQKVHNIIYIAVWFAAAHTLFGPGSKVWSLLAFVLACVQLASHVYSRIQKKKAYNSNIKPNN